MKRISLKDRNVNPESGLGAVELALIIPVLLVLLGAGIEFATIMYSYSQVSAIGREIGGVAFRECAAPAYKNIEGLTTAELDALKAEVNGCLSGVISETVPGFKVLNPDVELYISIYRHNSSTLPPATKLGSIGSVDGIENETKVLAEDFSQDVDPARHSLISQHQVLTYSEIFYTHNSFFPGIIDALSSSGGLIYAVSVY